MSMYGNARWRTNFVYCAVFLLLVSSSCFCVEGSETSMREEWHPGRILPLNFGFVNDSGGQNRIPLRHRRLLGEARMELFGHVLTKGYYYTNLLIGTPPQKFALIVDTGSTMTYVPCASCKNCGDHQDKPYSPSSSSTYQSISCNTSACKDQLCDSSNTCVYFRTYAEKSSSSGFVISDIINFSSSSTIDNQRLSFGCETMETGDLYTQTADGIIGLGRGKVGIIDQLVDSDAIEDVFSLCYGGMEYGGGAMILGSHPLPKNMVFTSFDPSASDGFYNLKIDSLRVNDKILAIPHKVFDIGYGTVLDSGTTFSYLPKQAFDAFYAAIKAGIKGRLKVVQGPDPQIPDDICFGGAPSDFSQLKNFFPKVEIVFSGNMTYELSLENYLFRHGKIPGAYCLGFFPAVDSGTLLGGIIVRNTLVNFDRRNNKIGFWKTNCRNLFSVLPPDSEFTNASALSPEPDSESNSDPNSVPTSNTPIGNSTSNLVFSSVCKGCASCIIVEVTLSITFNQFNPFKNEFILDMAREVGLHEKQVKIKNIANKDQGLWINLRILPYYPDVFITADTVQNILMALSSNQLVLRDLFGNYNITYVKVVPFNSDKKSPFRLWWILVMCIAFAVPACVILCFCFFKRRSRPASDPSSHYGNMGHIESPDFSEEEFFPSNFSFRNSR